MAQLFSDKSMTLLPLLVFVTQVSTALPAPEKVIAKVSGQEIHASEITPYLWEWYSQPVLQEIITNKLIADEAAKRKVEVADKEIQDAVQQYIAQVQQSLPSGQDIEAALRERTTPRSRLSMGMKTRLLAEKLAALEFRPETYVKISTMLVKPKSQSAADLKVALDKASSAYSKLKGGAKWEDVLKATVDDPALVQGNGELGWRLVQVLPENTQKELAGLKVGGYTTPVQTQYGIQIFRIDMKGPDLKGAELDALKKQLTPQLQQSLIQRLRQEAKIELVP